ncbi:MAG: B-box zinc finger protein [Sarcina sp.]
MSYCELHLTPHLRDPALQRHRLTDPATFPTGQLCRNHNKPLTMFCKNDQTPVCVSCTERHHKHHETVPMEKESKRIKVRKSLFYCFCILSFLSEKMNSVTQSTYFPLKPLNLFSQHLLFCAFFSKLYSKCYIF